MIENLFSTNTPWNFWQCQPNPSMDQWKAAVKKASTCLGLALNGVEIETIIALTLGEGQFGSKHWELDSIKRVYYALRPFLPNVIRNALKRINRHATKEFPLQWPIESRYVQFQWDVIRQILIDRNLSEITFRHFWPNGHRFAFVLTHDVETEVGLANIRTLADLDESLGFRSSFNFAPEKYNLDEKMIQDLLDRGFEVGVHGLKHDGKLFLSENTFNSRTIRINSYLEKYGSVGFRSPLTHRNPKWMQKLNIEYDLSFFDTDPFEPMPGGCMSIWPYTIGRFIELPYTLVQDSALLNVLGETTPRIWLEKLDFIEQHYGMALVNVHPDYLINSNSLEIYQSLLENIRNRENYWNALAKETAAWWRWRCENVHNDNDNEIVMGKIKRVDDHITIQ